MNEDKISIVCYRVVREISGMKHFYEDLLGAAIDSVEYQLRLDLTHDEKELCKENIKSALRTLGY